MKRPNWTGRWTKRWRPWPERYSNQGLWISTQCARLSADLKKEFPDMKGLSSRNLKYMRSFAEGYPTNAFVQEVLAQITWNTIAWLLNTPCETPKNPWALPRTAYCLANSRVSCQQQGRLRKGLAKRDNNKTNSISSSDSSLTWAGNETGSLAFNVMWAPRTEFVWKHTYGCYTHSNRSEGISL